MSENNLFQKLNPFKKAAVESEIIKPEETKQANEVAELYKGNVREDVKGYNIPTPDRLVKDILKHLNLNPKDNQKFQEFFNHKTILDIGSGTARVERYLRDRKDIDTRVISLDPKYDPESIESYDKNDKKEIKKLMDLNKQLRLNLVRGGIEDLPFKNESFDIAISHLFFPAYVVWPRDTNEINRKRVEQGVGEILRVLKPGGEARLYPVSLGHTAEFIQDFLKDKTEYSVEYDQKEVLLIIRKNKQDNNP